MVKQVLSEFFSPTRLYFVCGKVYENGTYANQVVHWFVQHKLPVVPVTPRGGVVNLMDNSITRTVTDSQELAIQKSISDGLEVSPLKSRIDGISACFVTPPAITLTILNELKEKKSPVISVWFQPGSWDMKCIKASEEGLKIPSSRIINDCVLVNGAGHYRPSSLTI
ncbi:LAMI_0H01068g1_1 [Lachancea mirantina]|uniref:LAMI_0H01068g1_1 n=1 Tax=Lachancea mirantina TaxID=1230905 RepID=A0A1G4KDZ9_9SACH|nr:LAMI_0H01068g1_1 [Lachancea mirantina]